jgi:hypothetical protein
MSRTAAAPGSRWMGWRPRAFARTDDPCWLKVPMKDGQKRRCRSCRFNGGKVRMRIWDLGDGHRRLALPIV